MIPHGQHRYQERKPVIMMNNKMTRIIALALVIAMIVTMLIGVIAH